MRAAPGPRGLLADLARWLDRLPLFLEQKLLQVNGEWNGGVR